MVLPQQTKPVGDLTLEQLLDPSGPGQQALQAVFGAEPDPSGRTLIQHPFK